MRDDGDKTTIDCIEVQRTGSAILVTYDEDRPDVWLPLASVKIERRKCSNPAVKMVQITLSEKLAESKGMA